MSAPKDPVVENLINSLLCDRCGHSRIPAGPRGLAPCTCLRYMQQAVRRRPDTVARAA